MDPLVQIGYVVRPECPICGGDHGFSLPSTSSESEKR